MGQEVVLFHSALGLTPSVRAFADNLRKAGHVVHTPDLFNGEVFEDLDEGIRKRDALGIGELIGRAQAAVADLPAAIVLAGSSMGTGAAEFLAATRPGARAAILMHGAFDPAAFGIDSWPTVPVEVHYSALDPRIEVDQIDAFAEAVRSVGVAVQVHVYERGGHLFEDPACIGYDGRSAQLMLERVLGFLAGLLGDSHSLRT